MEVDEAIAYSTNALTLLSRHQIVRKNWQLLDITVQYLHEVFSGFGLGRIDF